MAAGQINFTDVYFTQLQVAICIPGGWGGVPWGRKTGWPAETCDWGDCFYNLLVIIILNA